MRFPKKTLSLYKKKISGLILINITNMHMQHSAEYNLINSVGMQFFNVKVLISLLDSEYSSSQKI